jgi:hypothetical protein
MARKVRPSTDVASTVFGNDVFYSIHAKGLKERQMGQPRKLSVESEFCMGVCEERT